MSAGRKRRLLLVDDHPANIQVLAEALRDRYDLFVATHGARALERAAQGGIDLVLLDVQMPGMDGFEVCRRLKEDERTRAIPVVFVTALGEVADETKGFDVGGIDYITKPISPPVVRARVRTHLELKETRDLLQELASIDPLTGIGNRRRFDVCFDCEWRRAVRGAHWISLALLDVDDFKRYNDRYGHARGDECLRSVAQAVAAACGRSMDLAARYGGEEFVLLLPETDPDGARALVTGLLERVRDLAIEHADSRCDSRVTVSVGAVSLIPSTETPAEVLERVDALLYEAKGAGRRRAFHLDAASGEKEEIVLGIQAGGGG